MNAADGSELIDLTRRIESGMPTFPGDPAVRVDPHATHERDGYRVSELRLGTHTGTHVDAPAHVDPAGATLDSFALEDLRFEARVVNCRDVGPSAAIGPDALPDSTALDDLGALVFDTGWADQWGTDRMPEHPFLAPETARRCADADVAVVTDALSPDPSDRESDLPAHRALCGAGLPVVENVCNLDALSMDGFELLVCPLRIDADGAPARVVARV
ncbi:cyclase family protein [Halobellus rufus]|uniref:cyclase family protein n=1 Tax=Halobellus rufus TaxID=1448860 RepID=UPI000678ECF3|nr:cyclase family protein [Halobellus rufus]